VNAPLQALAAPRRREILRLIWRDEKTAGDIHRAMDDVTFGAVSQHLRVLLDSGLARRRREGRHQLYEARQTSLEPFRAWLESSWDEALYRLKLKAELEEARRGPRPRSRRRRIR
jgi:DNA-binding transcriptional ArsR family regulator